jgi:hypothetical protein
MRRMERRSARSLKTNSGDPCRSASPATPTPSISAVYLFFARLNSLTMPVFCRTIRGRSYGARLMKTLASACDANRSNSFRRPLKYRRRSASAASVSNARVIPALGRRLFFLASRFSAR